MVVAGILAITFYILLAVSFVVGFIISAKRGDDDMMFVAFIAAWFFGVLGTISLIAFAVTAIIQVVQGIN